MDEPLQQDPWEVLGLPKTATQAEIRGGWKKWALKNHPDKFTDPVEKKAKETVFHGGQLAYETLTDPEKLQEYKTSVQMYEMKQEMLANQARTGGNSSRPSEATGPYKTRECAPSFATAPPKTQERHSSYEDDEYYNKPKKSSSKQHYERPSARTEKASVRAATDKKRSDTKKYHDKAKKSDRSETLYERARPDSDDSDGHAKVKRSYRDEDHTTKKYDDIRRQAEETIRRDSASDRRKADKLRETRDREYSRDRDRDRHNVYTATREHSSRESERPSPRRSGSSAYESRSEKTATARRSHATPKERQDSYRPIIVEEPEQMDPSADYGADYSARRPERRMPSMPTTTSSPAALRAHVQDPPTRSYSYHYPSTHESSPKIKLGRSETMPVHSNSSRHRDVPHSSKLREEDRGDSGYSSPGTPEMSYPHGGYASQPSGATAAAGVRYVSKDDFSRSSQSANFVTREPTTNAAPRYTTVSPKRRSGERERSPMVSSRPKFTEPQYAAPPPLARSSTFAYPDKTSSRPSMAAHAASSQATPRIVEEFPDRDRERERGRGRDRNLAFGEIPSEYHSSHKAVRPGHERRTSYRPDEVNFARKYTHADVVYGGSKEEEELIQRGIEIGRRQEAERRAAEMERGDRYNRPIPGLKRRETAAAY